jgi:PAS domain S-box-containing protein
VHERGKIYRDPNGAPVRMIGTVHDITEQKAAEAELARYREHLEERVRERTADVERMSRRNAIIVGAAMDGFFTASMDGRVNDCNEAYCRMLGYTREEMLALHISDLDADESPEEMAAHIRKICAEGRDHFDTRHRRKDGGHVHVEANVSLEEISGERLFFAFVHDITERKQNEAALTHTKEEAERANRAKSEFLSRMSHELRTPLNAILGFGQLLESDLVHPLAEEQRQNVREILHGGRHLLEMINEVLDLARIESGSLPVSLEPLALESTLRECHALVTPLAKARGIRLDGMHLPSCSGVLADRVRLKQVLLNLLSNAVKYNRDQGSVTVSCTCGNDTVRIAVTDTGPGLTPEQIALLFRPFERLDADKAAIEGTGIGLALSKRLTELMQGRIGVESTPGVGTTFWVELPAASTKPALTSPGAQVADQPALAGIRTLLYIEDNPANTRLMERILGKMDSLRLITADRPGIGMELAEAHGPDLILLDINLPDMDGYTVLARLRAQAPTRAIPVIGISANAMPKDLERARAAGFADYLTKPLDIGLLKRAIQQVLEGEGQAT